MGPVAELVERCGGSAARVFAHAELPLRLVDEPDRLILLRDQLALLESASREIGDEALSARLSIEAGFPSLGPYGRRALRMPTLDRAIRSASETVGPLLQTATSFSFVVSAGQARWTYRVTEHVLVGRQRNEMLAAGYMLDLFRRFCGRGWVPTRVEVSGSLLGSRAALESVFGCDVRSGDGATIVFPARLLRQPNPGRLAGDDGDRGALPDPDDLVACLTHLLGVRLLDARPSIAWLCRHLGTSRRTLQRALAARGTAFESVLQDALAERAVALLRAGATATDIALELGYSDLAHFTRAFRRWTATTPSAWRRAERDRAT